MTNFPVYVIDAFPTGENDVFTGGPAAIVILQFDDDISDISKQKLASSMNLSETAFVSLAWERTPQNEKLSDQIDGTKLLKRTLRWFTPAEEVPLCGHATQAAVKALLKHYQILTSSDDVVIERVEFETKCKGILTAQLKKENQAELITISLPANPTIPIDITDTLWAPSFLRILLGPSFPDPIGSVQDMVESQSMRHYLLVRLKRVTGESPSKTLLRVKNNAQELLEADSGTAQMRLLIVTIEGEGSSGPDFYCRVFCPYFGIHEDPVCGSAQTLLTPYWTKELGREGQALKIRQLSPRGGQFLGILKGEEVELTGTARVVIVGEVQL